MKVSLVVQALSRSVGDTIEFCDKELKLKAFENFGPTVKFISLIDRLFDVMNLRNPFGKDSKAPLCPKNRCVCKLFLNEAFDYLLNPKDMARNLMHEGQGK